MFTLFQTLASITWFCSEASFVHLHPRGSYFGSPHSIAANENLIFVAWDFNGYGDDMEMTAMAYPNPNGDAVEVWAI